MKREVTHVIGMHQDLIVQTEVQTYETQQYKTYRLNFLLIGANFEKPIGSLVLA